MCRVQELWLLDALSNGAYFYNNNNRISNDRRIRMEALHPASSIQFFNSSTRREWEGGGLGDVGDFTLGIWQGNWFGTLE